jgi:hypothetical protein
MRQAVQTDHSQPAQPRFREQSDQTDHRGRPQFGLHYSAGPTVRSLTRARAALVHVDATSAVIGPSGQPLTAAALGTCGVKGTIIDMRCPLAKLRGISARRRSRNLVFYLPLKQNKHAWDLNRICGDVCSSCRHGSRMPTGHGGGACFRACPCWGRNPSASTAS